MTSPISDLEPKAVWEHFGLMCGIPHGSGNEEALGRHILERAAKRRLEARRDEAGNIVVRKPASEGREDRSPVVLQGHLDMVCEKNSDVDHDFARDPIRLRRDGDWIEADGTTLGADNGIGVAMALAVMDADSLAHPPLELLFTVDEETGLAGALGLEDGLLEGRILLNLDSEEEGALYIGCAGGRNTTLLAEARREAVPEGHRAFRIRILGLRGGHSGLEIHEGYGNAIRILARLLTGLGREGGLRVAAAGGGSLHNAIPREAEAIVTLHEDRAPALENRVRELAAVVRRELAPVDPGLVVNCEGTDTPETVLSPIFAGRLVGLLHTVPNGVVGMSRTVSGLVETSTNLAVLETGEERVEILTSQRSSSASALADISSRVRTLGELLGFEGTHGAAYPAWPPNPGSGILSLCRRVYRSLWSRDAEVKAIHVGLECGLIGEKHPGMDMVSFGPDIRGAHSPDERVNVESVAHTFTFLREVLAAIE